MRRHRNARNFVQITVVGSMVSRLFLPSTAAGHVTAVWVAAHARPLLTPRFVQRLLLLLLLSSSFSSSSFLLLLLLLLFLLLLLLPPPHHPLPCRHRICPPSSSFSSSSFSSSSSSSVSFPSCPPPRLYPSLGILAHPLLLLFAIEIAMVPCCAELFSSHCRLLLVS
jgi:hypothetical protein